MFDSACIYFRYDVPCDKLGNCWAYDNYSLSWRVLTTVLVGIGANFIFSFLAWLFYPSKQKVLQEEEDNHGKFLQMENMADQSGEKLEVDFAPEYPQTATEFTLLVPEVEERDEEEDDEIYPEEVEELTYIDDVTNEMVEGEDQESLGAANPLATVAEEEAEESSAEGDQEEEEPEADPVAESEAESEAEQESEQEPEQEAEQQPEVQQEAEQIPEAEQEAGQDAEPEAEQESQQDAEKDTEAEPEAEQRGDIED